MFVKEIIRLNYNIITLKHFQVKYFLKGNCFSSINFVYSFTGTCWKNQPRLRPAYLWSPSIWRRRRRHPRSTSSSRRKRSRLCSPGPTNIRRPERRSPRRIQPKTLRTRRRRKRTSRCSKVIPQKNLMSRS